MNKSPVFQVFDRREVLIDLQFTSLDYVYSEELEDSTELTIKSANPSDVDHPAIQEDQSIFIKWGYIGEPKSFSKRKVYIIDSTASFTDSGLTLILKCVPKAGYLKLRPSKSAKENTTLGEVIAEGAAAIGLEVVDMVTKDGSGILQTGFTQSSYPVVQTFQNKDNPNDPRNGEISLTGFTVAIDNARVRKNYTWKIYNDYVQANKTPAQSIDELKTNEPLLDLVVSGRDDKLEIKQRNFGQKPVRVYVWAGGDGELLDFRSGIDNSGNRGATASINASGWASESKEFIETSINPLDNAQVSLGEEIPGPVIWTDRLVDPTNPFDVVEPVVETPQTVVDSFQKLEIQKSVKISGLYTEYRGGVDEEGNEQTNLKQTNSIDGLTFATYIRKGTVPVRVSEDFTLKQANDVTSRIPVHGLIPIVNGKTQLTVEQTPGNIAGYAASNQERYANELSKSSFRVIGTPEIIEGRIIRILGVSKKYSGNWYITKAAHKVDTGGWIIDGEITRKTARGKTEGINPGNVNVKDLSRNINDQNNPAGEDYVIPSNIEN